MIISKKTRLLFVFITFCMSAQLINRGNAVYFHIALRLISCQESRRSSVVYTARLYLPEINCQALHKEYEDNMHSSKIMLRARNGILLLTPYCFNISS